MAFPLYDQLLDTEEIGDLELSDRLNSLSEEKIGDTKISEIIHLLILHHHTMNSNVDYWGKNKAILPYGSKTIGQLGIMYNLENLPVETKKKLWSFVKLLT